MLVSSGVGLDMPGRAMGVEGREGDAGGRAVDDIRVTQRGVFLDMLPSCIVNVARCLDFCAFCSFLALVLGKDTKGEASGSTQWAWRTG